MKKIMLFLIALIPVALIFTIQVTSSVVRTTTYVSVEKVSFEENYKVIKKTDEKDVTLEFPARVSPVSATDKNVVYSSSDENIATVDENGLITFKDFGTVIITVVSSVTNSIQDKCTFFVTDDKAHRINFTNPISQMTKGDEYYLKTEIIPNEALNKNITFSSSNSSVASVAADGRLVAVDGGACTIKVTTANGKEDSFDVFVFVPVKGVSIGEVKNSITTAKNTAKFPKVSIIPSNATNQNIIYASSDNTIGTISQNGDIQLLKKGIVTFSATSEDGNHSVEYKINYTGGYVTSAELSSEFLNKTITVAYEKDKILTLEYVVEPPDYLQSHIDNIWWESSNENVIKIEGDNIVVVGGGTADVYLKALIDEGKTIESKTTIFVTRPANSITIKDDGNSDLGDTANDDIIVTDTLSKEILYQILTKDGTFDHTDDVIITTDNGTITKGANNNFYLEFSEVKAQSASITIVAGSVSKSIVIQYIIGSAENITVEDGDEIKLEYGKIYSFWIQNDTYSWTGFDNSILKLNDDGTFTAILGGTTTMSTTSGGGENVEISIEVYRAGQDIYLDGAAITNTSIVTANSSWKLNASVYTADSTERQVVFESSSTDIATVDATGAVVFNAAGKVTITMRAKKHPLQTDFIIRTISITSTMGKPTYFEFVDDSDITIADIGSTAQICIGSVFEPSDYALNADEVSFITGNAGIATVEKSVVDGKVYGTITGVDGGTTTISAIIGGVQKTINVTVNVLSKEIYVQFFDGDVYKDVIPGVFIDIPKLQLYSRFVPENTTNKNCKWEIIEGAESTISNDGLLTYKNYGRVRIRITAEDTGIWYERVIGYRIPEMYVYQVETDVTGQNLAIGRTDANPTFRVNLKKAEDIASYMFPFDYSGITCSSNNLDVSVVNNEDGVFTIKRLENHTVSLKATLTFEYMGKKAYVYVKFLALDDVDVVYTANGRDLVLDNDLDKTYGFEQKLVFGTSSYRYVNEGDTTRTHISNFMLNYKPYPSTNTDKLNWSVKSDAGFAWIDSTTGCLNFIVDKMVDGENILEVSVHDESDINASSIKNTYRMIVIKRGINVTDEESYNFTTNCGHDWKLILLTNLGTQEDDDGIKPYAPLSSNILKQTIASCFYGNGFTINYHNFESNSDIQFYGEARNIVFKGHNDSTESFTRAFCTIKHIYSTTYNYVTFKNAEECMFIDQQNFSVVFYKCLFMNGASCGLMLGRSSNSDGDPTVYLEDCVFYNHGQCAISYQEGSIKIKGRFDVYNFRAASDYDNATYKKALEYAYSTSEFNQYVDRTSTPVANVGIASFTSLSGIQSDVTFYDEATGTYISTDNTTGRNLHILKGTTKPTNLGFITIPGTHIVNLWMESIYDSSGNPIQGVITKNTQVDYSILYRIGIN